MLRKILPIVLVTLLMMGGVSCGGKRISAIEAYTIAEEAVMLVDVDAYLHDLYAGGIPFSSSEWRDDYSPECDGYASAWHFYFYYPNKNKDVCVDVSKGKADISSSYKDPPYQPLSTGELKVDSPAAQQIADRAIREKFGDPPVAEWEMFTTTVDGTLVAVGIELGQTYGGGLYWIPATQVNRNVPLHLKSKRPRSQIEKTHFSVY